MAIDHDRRQASAHESAKSFTNVQWNCMQARVAAIFTPTWEARPPLFVPRGGKVRSPAHQRIIDRDDACIDDMTI